MTELKHQWNELIKFTENHPHFDSVTDFENEYNGDMDHLYTQLEWIENGSYGEGACIALQRVWLWVKDNNRVNKCRHIGNILIKAIYGANFEGKWKKLSPSFQREITYVAQKWIEKPKDFAITLVDELRYPEPFKSSYKG